MLLTQRDINATKRGSDGFKHFPPEAKFCKRVVFPQGCAFGPGTVFSPGAKFLRYCTFGPDTLFGDFCHIGPNCAFSLRTFFGQRVWVGEARRFVLGSPNFRKCQKALGESTVSGQAIEQALKAEPPPIESVKMEPVIEMVAAEEVDEGVTMSSEVQGYRLVLLRFFRDLTEGERLHMLVELDALPVDSDERITQAVERQMLDWLVRGGRIAEIEQKIDQLISSRKERPV